MKYGGSVVVLKVDMHCKGCGKKVKRYLKHLKGVDDVKIDCEASKVTVIGNVDPAGIREKLAEKIKRKVDLVSSPPKKGGFADTKPPKYETLEKKKGESGDKKPPKDETLDKKKTEKKKEEGKTSPKQRTMVLKTKFHREGFISKIRRVISKIKGDRNLKTNGEVIPPSKDAASAGTGGKNDRTGSGGKKKDKKATDDDGGSGAKKKKTGESGGEGGNTAAGGGKKKDKKTATKCGGEKKEKTDESGGEVGNAAAGGGKKKDKKAATNGGGGGAKKEKARKTGTEDGITAAGGSDDGAKVEMNKREHNDGYSYPTQPMYHYDGQTLTIGNQGHVYGQNYVMESHPSEVYAHPPYGSAGQMSQGYVRDPNAHFHASQMFSDENPNACSIM